ncbi:DUF1697 domain-containing protein [Pseudenhygromyxa sp. WMMC2535]|uniref:DUF1697 domain-containing protein n=1 Tax=Pseudenhygromyxa sp. WMMC2535 TaxID=2712867 RepID=UPI0015523F19|nr:DUF1697 domain-containing protein [Pseudenhygromyxa sp. WMMC2535]NVB40865.1 DUF1697 domain-containing protein [Pseudenhygromyxa sp. WMMC2535]
MAASKVHVALLRGINVGGKHKLPMKTLARIFADQGAEDVKTYIQSGNVVYRASAAAAKGMATAVAEAIADELGFEAPVTTRSLDQLRELIESNPFSKESDPTRLHVAFLAKRPTAAAVASLDPDRSPPDVYEVVGSEIYMHCPKGMARTKLSCAYFDSKLGTVSTMRNWRTTTKLLELAAAL